MALKEAYLIGDIGTGNARVAVCGIDGEILSIKRENVQYETDVQYEDSIFFNPEELWSQILKLSKEALAESGEVKINAITATSQREGIVVVDQAGKSRSEEHTSELQSRENLVCRLLLEKKK